MAHLNKKRKREQRNYAYVQTINNYHDGHPAIYKLLHEQGKIGYAILGFEQAPTTGTNHIQGYVRFREGITMSQCRKLFPGARIAKAEGTDLDNQKYCGKLPGAIEYGTVASPGKRTDLSAVRDMVRAGMSDNDIAGGIDGFQALSCVRTLKRMIQVPEKDRLTPPTVFWCSGPTGSGKSTFATNFGKKHPNIWRMHHDLMWFDRYTGQTTAIIDDFRTNMVHFAFFLKLLDRYPLMVPTKGDFALWTPTYIIVTSPKSCKDTFQSKYDDEDVTQITRRIKHHLVFTKLLGENQHDDKLELK